MKRYVDIFDYAGHICKELKKGILLTSKTGDTVNTMTIGWGHIGIEWNRPIFVAYVRESRFTKHIMDENGEFTVNIPYNGDCKNILSYCGQKSGRDTDKIVDLGLTLETPDKIGVPGIRELPLTLECRVIYQQTQNQHEIPEAIIQRFYPAENEKGACDIHTAYYGEIVSAYIIED